MGVAKRSLEIMEVIFTKKDWNFIFLQISV